jgi:hypothetical protein
MLSNSVWWDRSDVPEILAIPNTDLTVRSFFLVLDKLVESYIWCIEPALHDDLLEF